MSITQRHATLRGASRVKMNTLLILTLEVKHLVAGKSHMCKVPDLVEKEGCTGHKPPRPGDRDLHVTRPLTQRRGRHQRLSCSTLGQSGTEKQDFQRISSSVVTITFIFSPWGLRKENSLQTRDSPLLPQGSLHTALRVSFLWALPVSVTVGCVLWSSQGNWSLHRLFLCSLVFRHLSVSGGAV